MATDTIPPILGHSRAPQRWRAPWLGSEGSSVKDPLPWDHRTAFWGAAVASPQRMERRSLSMLRNPLFTLGPDSSWTLTATFHTVLQPVFPNASFFTEKKQVCLHASGKAPGKCLKNIHSMGSKRQFSSILSQPGHRWTALRISRKTWNILLTLLRENPTGSAWPVSGPKPAADS